MSQDEKTNWNLITELNWEEIKKDMISSDEDKFGDQSNKEKLLFLILKLTGIKFDDIKISENNDYKLTLRTSKKRPDMGIIGKYIVDFEFSLHYRTPMTYSSGVVVLSFHPSLNYRLMSLGSNGFDTDGWFYYNVLKKEWTLR